MFLLIHLQSTPCILCLNFPLTLPLPLSFRRIRSDQNPMTAYPFSVHGSHINSGTQTRQKCSIFTNAVRISPSSLSLRLETERRFLQTFSKKTKMIVAGNFSNKPEKRLYRFSQSNGKSDFCGFSQFKLISRIFPIKWENRFLKGSPGIMEKTTVASSPSLMGNGRYFATSPIIMGRHSLPSFPI